MSSLCKTAGRRLYNVRYTRSRSAPESYGDRCSDTRTYSPTESSRVEAVNTLLTLTTLIHNAAANIRLTRSNLRCVNRSLLYASRRVLDIKRTLARSNFVKKKYDNHINSRMSLIYYNRMQISIPIYTYRQFIPFDFLCDVYSAEIMFIFVTQFLKHILLLMIRYPANKCKRLFACIPMYNIICQ